MVSFSCRNSNDDDEDGEDDGAGHKEVALPLSQLPLSGERIQWVDGVQALDRTTLDTVRHSKSTWCFKSLHDGFSITT